MDDTEHPVIGFGIVYSDELMYCEAVMQQDHYEVLLNGVWTGAVAYTENFE